MPQIKCRFCQKKLGTIDNLSDVADARCDEHEVEFWSYKKMSEEFEQKTGKGNDEFKKLIKKAEYKKINFDKEMKKI